MSPHEDAIAFVTGANGGLGYESCRQLAVHGVGTIIVGCRSEEKANAAVDKLVSETGRDRSVFRMQTVDMTSESSLVACADALPHNLSMLLLNAGGFASSTIDERGVLESISLNVLGNATLVDCLIKQGKLAKGARIIASSSEAGRGVTSLLARRPMVLDTKTKTAAHIDTVLTGKAYSILLPHILYGESKAILSLYWKWLGRRFKKFYFLSVSPGFTGGTNLFGAEQAPFYISFLMQSTRWLQDWLHLTHSVEVGAKRSVDILLSTEQTAGTSGTFLASASEYPTGALGDQSIAHPAFDDEELQDAVATALRRHLVS